MKIYTKKNPVFNEEIMITETGDPGHADNINAAPKQILENTLANRKELREGDSKDRTVTFVSGDADADTANEWTDVPKMTSGESHKSLIEKISTMFKNVRFLYKLLGSTDLSEIGDGTVAGILAALKPYCFADPVDHLLANIKGKPLDATQGAVVQGEIDDLREAVTQINSDFTILKRESMAAYGYFGIEWNIDNLMALVRAGSWDKFAIGDYFIETTTTGEKIQWEVAGKNSYLYCGDTELNKNHIVCCPRDCLQTYYKFNTTNTNAGGYAASLIPANLEAEANKFSSKLQGYMTTIRRLENNKGAWERETRRIFLPGNPELIGFHGWADKYDGGAFNQLPLFVGGNAHLLKGAGFNKSKTARMSYWTADPSGETTTYFCSLSGRGYSDRSYATTDNGIAPLIVLS